MRLADSNTIRAGSRYFHLNGLPEDHSSVLRIGTPVGAISTGQTMVMATAMEVASWHQLAVPVMRLLMSASI